MSKWGRRKRRIKKYHPSSPSSYHLTVTPQCGMGSEELLPIWNCGWLDLCRSYSGKHSCCGFESAVILLCPQDTLSTQLFLILVFTILPPLLPWGFPSFKRRDLMEISNLDSLQVMSGCGFLHLFPFAAGGSFSDDWIRY